MFATGNSLQSSVRGRLLQKGSHYLNPPLYQRNNIPEKPSNSISFLNNVSNSADWMGRYAQVLNDLRKLTSESFGQFEGPIDSRTMRYHNLHSSSDIFHEREIFPSYAIFIAKLQEQLPRCVFLVTRPSEVWLSPEIQKNSQNGCHRALL